MRNRLSLAVLLLTSMSVAARAAEIGVGGRALGPGARPLAEADVLLVRAEDPSTRARREIAGTDLEPVARGKTGSDGFFDIVAPGPGVYTLRVAAPGFVPVIYPLAPLLEPVELPDATLEVALDLTIRVLGNDGHPLSGATARISEPRTRGREQGPRWANAPRVVTTGADGSTRVARGESESLVLTVGASGFLVQERRNVRGTSTTFRLETGVNTALLVRSADGKPAASALVTSIDNDHPLGFTDANGALRLAVPARGGLRVSAQALDGGRSEGTVLPPKPEAAQRKLLLPALRTVSGRVIDAESRHAITSAWVWRSDDPWAAVATDGNGAYSLAVPGRGATSMIAGAGGYLSPEPVEVAPDAGEGSAPTIALAPAAALEGTVVDGAGKAVGGAKLRLESKRAGNGMMVVVRMGSTTPTAFSSARGRFRLSGIDPSKAYDLEARAVGYAPGTKEILGLEPRKTIQGIRLELERGQRVLGRVLDGTGQPIREAEVKARSASRDRVGFGMVMLGDASKPELPSAATDSDGRFVISGMQAGTFDFSVRRRGFAKKSVAGIDVKKGPDPVDLGDLVLEPGERLLGQVSDPDGRPIEGVQVSISETPEGGPMFLGRGALGPNRAPDALTGLDGWFALEDLQKGEPVRLELSRKGYVDGSESGVKVPATEPMQITLRPSSKVSGTVLDRDGKPIPGADVSLTRDKTGGIGGAVIRMVSRDNASTDDTGKFVFEGVEPGTIALRAKASGWQETKLDALEVPKGADLEGVDLRLDPGAIITGRVTAPDGRPAIGAAVRVVSEGSEEIRFSGPGTDGDGRYRLEGVERGKVTIEATHPDYVRTAKELDARTGVNVLNLQLEGGNEVAGVLVDAGGAPIAGAWVRLAPRGSDFGGPETTSRPDGTFRLAGVSDGDYAAWAGRKGYASSDGVVSVKIEGQPVHDVRIELGAAASVSGTVSGIDPERLSQIAIRAFGAGMRAPATAGVDRRGHYKLDDLSPGTWTVIASLESSGEQARGEAVLEPGAPEATLDLRFEPGVTLSGRVTHADAPVKGASLFAEGVDVDHSGSGRTGADGTFSIRGLEPGTYRLDVRQWESGLSSSQTYEVRESREVTLEIPSAVVSGIVVDSADHQPLSGVTLALSPTSTGSSPLPSFLTDRGVTTDQNGHFRIMDLQDGPWRLSASRKGYAASTRSLDVQNGRGAEDLRLELDPTEGLTLEVRLPSGRAPDEVSAAVLAADGRPLTRGRFATGENGKVRLSSVPPGSWEIVLSSQGSGTVSVQAAAPGGPVPISLPPACGLKVSVPDLGESEIAASATLASADGRPFRSLAWFSDPVSVWRLRRGEMELDSLPPGSWTIHVSAADGRSWQGTAATSPGAQATVVLR